MKLLYSVILLLAIAQLVITKPIDNSASSSAITTIQQLSRYFNQELKLLAADTCAKLKNVSEHILNDAIIQRSESLLVKEFKQNITEYQELYEVYKKFHLYDELVLIFAATASPYYYQKHVEDSNFQYIRDLLKKFNHEEIMHEYELKFMTFMSDKFLPKLSELEKSMEHNHTQNMEKFFKWSQEIRECGESYDCYRIYIKQYHQIVLTPKQIFLKYINQQLYQLNLFYGSGIVRVAKAMKKSAKLSELPQDLQQKLMLSINEFIVKYDSSQDIQQFYDLSQLFYQSVIKEFYYKNDHRPMEEQQVLKAIFYEAGYEKFAADYRKKFSGFLDCGVVQEFEHFRVTLTATEILAENDLLNWFERFKSLNTIYDKNNSFDDLFEITKNVRQ